MIEPSIGLAWITRPEGRRPIKIEAAHTWALNPAAERDQAIPDNFWRAGRPRHLLDGFVAVEPCGCLDRFMLAVLFCRQRNRRDACVDAGCRPHFAVWCEDVAMH